MNLPAGEYQISVVGMIYDGGMSVSKVLSKGGYFNENVMTFRIEDGKTTTLDVRPDDPARIWRLAQDLHARIHGKDHAGYGGFT